MDVMSVGTALFREFERDVWSFSVFSVRSYLVSGTKNTTQRKLMPTSIAAIHLCHRQLKFDTMKPHTKGPIVLPLAMEFM